MYSMEYCGGGGGGGDYYLTKYEGDNVSVEIIVAVNWNSLQGSVPLMLGLNNVCGTALVLCSGYRALW